MLCEEKSFVFAFFGANTRKNNHFFATLGWIIEIYLTICNKKAVRFHSFAEKSGDKIQQKSQKSGQTLVLKNLGFCTACKTNFEKSKNPRNLGKNFFVFFKKVVDFKPRFMAHLDSKET